MQIAKDNTHSIALGSYGADIGQHLDIYANVNTEGLFASFTFKNGQGEAEIMMWHLDKSDINIPYFQLLLTEAIYRYDLLCELVAEKLSSGFINLKSYSLLASAGIDVNHTLKSFEFIKGKRHYLVEERDARVCDAVCPDRDDFTNHKEYRQAMNAYMNAQQSAFKRQNSELDVSIVESSNSKAIHAYNSDIAIYQYKHVNLDSLVTDG